MSNEKRRKSRQSTSLDKENKNNNSKNSDYKTTRRKRANNKRKKRKNKFIVRRLILLLILISILFFAIRTFVNAINSYKKPGYPAFRDEVLDSLGSEVFVSPSENRSLSTAEKITDFDNLFSIIQKNYAIDNLNREDFLKFSDQYNDFRKKIAASKTDQDYFSLLNKYLDTLDDTRTFVLDKQTYDNLFEYYRKQGDSPNKLVLENPQAVDRYKRLLQNSNLEKPSMKVEKIANGVALITLKDFKPSEFNDDLKKITDSFRENAPISTVVLDLSDNKSIDSVYRKKLAEIFINDDYQESNMVFYRSNLFTDTLKYYKENEKNPYKSAFVKNDASKYPDNIESINPEEYLYYDQISLDIKRNPEYANRKVYVLTNSDTANEAIKFASVLQNSGANIVKNALESANTYKDVIYNVPSNLYVLEHSGLILSINSAYSKNEENKYIEYNQKINSKDPINSILNIIN